MRLIKLLVTAIWLRNPVRTVFLLLAIVTASCLVVWLVGGYQSLFSEGRKNNPRPLGVYDLKVERAATGRGGPGRQGGPGGRGGGPMFSPLAKSFTRPGSAAREGRQGTHGTPGTEKEAGRGQNRGQNRGPRRGPGSEPGKGQGRGEPRRQFDPFLNARGADGVLVLERLGDDVPAHLRAKLNRADIDGDGVLSLAEERTLYPEGNEAPGTAGDAPEPSGKTARRGHESGTIPIDVIDGIDNDPRVALCDCMREVQAFCFSPKEKRNSMARGQIRDQIRDQSPSAPSNLSVPQGIDPVLHRQGLIAYRAVMGIPAGLGSPLIGTNAKKAPIDLEKGRWFTNNTEAAYEAVLSKPAASRFGVETGDPIWVLTRRSEEFQLTVIGILDDEEQSTFYIPKELADRIAGNSEVDSLGIALAKGETAESFHRRWGKQLGISSDSDEQAATGTGAITGAITIVTNDDIIAKRQADSSSGGMKIQALSGAFLAILSSMMIIFTALSIGVEERRRQIALARSVALSRAQIAVVTIAESLFLAIPGWLGGLLAGWLILKGFSNQSFRLNGTMIAMSFLCAVIGSLAAAFVPLLKACAVRPLEAIVATQSRMAVRPNKSALTIVTVIAVALIGADLGIIYGVAGNNSDQAAPRLGTGLLLLAAGTLLLIPALIRFSESIFLPILAKVLGFDTTIFANELSTHTRRGTAVVSMLAIGGGLFVLMQVWGYSMLGPFLPNDQMPDAFASFFPVGLDAEYCQKMRDLPEINSDQFQKVTLEQAALSWDNGGEGQAANTAAPPSANASANAFANVIVFGMDVDSSFVGSTPLVRLKLKQGSLTTALEAMKTGRGVVINDALTVDYGLKLGDTLKLIDPKNPGRVLEYPIVGVTTFDGWQWLSKTGGLRRNFGRSGGIAFASDRVIRDDYQKGNNSAFFWFNLSGSANGTNSANSAIEQALTEKLDALAIENYRALGDKKLGNTAYCKLSTRQSLRESIASRADNVIRGLSTMPLVTLALMSIALVAVMVNSVRQRRRWFGIMRAIGVERAWLFKMILAESILLGLTSALAALIFGGVAAAGILRLAPPMFGVANPTMILPVQGLAWGLGLLLTLTIAAAIVPAYQASRSEILAMIEMMGEE